MENNTHIVEKVSVEVSTQDIKSMNPIKDNISLFLSNEVFPIIVSALDRFGFKDTFIRLEKLNLEFPIVLNDDLISINMEIQSSLEKQLNQQIYEKVYEYTSEQNINNIEKVKEHSKIQNLEEIFLFYLENGYYPWYGNRAQLQEFIEGNELELSFKNEVFISRLKKLLKEKRVFQRFVSQFFKSRVFSNFLLTIRFAEIHTHISEMFSYSQDTLRTNYLYTLFTLLSETDNKRIQSVLEEWIQQLQQLKSHELGYSLTREILKSIAMDLLKLEQMQDVINKLLDYTSGNETKMEINQEIYSLKADKKELSGMILKNTSAKNETEFFDQNLNEIRVKNAGLVILHPFLKQLFYTLKFTDKQNQILPDKQMEAVQLLHYLANGEEEFWEGDMVFAKFLCGMPLNSSIEMQSLLTDNMKEEGLNLLNEVIKKWPALKNTSPDGLREAFLQRDGKLIKRERNYRLIMERKTVDVLLEKLSWNISLIKIPWTKELIYVEW